VKMYSQRVSVVCSDWNANSAELIPSQVQRCVFLLGAATSKWQMKAGMSLRRRVK